MSTAPGPTCKRPDCRNPRSCVHPINPPKTFGERAADLIATHNGRSAHVGRPPRQLIDGDIAVSQADNNVYGLIYHSADGTPMCQWEDMDEPYRLDRCGMVLTMRRAGEVLSWES